jgi:hypothetical protein
MHSAAHRGVTVVTVVTLLYASVLKHHHWVRVLVGRKQTTVRVVCKPAQPCPAQLRRVKTAAAPKNVQAAPAHRATKSTGKAKSKPKAKTRPSVRRSRGAGPAR